MDIARVKNEIIVEKRNVKSYVRSSEAVEGFGWYEINDNKPNLEEWQTTSHEDIYENNQVNRVYTIIDMSLEDYKNQKLSSLRAYYGEIIAQTYPLYKQLNISRLAEGYTQTDLDNMNLFIDGKRDECNTFEDLINNSINYQEVKEITWVV